jgi:hypothetical protein
MEQPSERVMRWKAAWESRDVDAIVAMYRPDAIHESSLVPRFYPEAGGTALRGTNQIRAYFANALGRFTELRFELVSVPNHTSNHFRANHRTNPPGAPRSSIAAIPTLTAPIPPTCSNWCNGRAR